MRCLDVLIHRVGIQGVVVSVERATATTTGYGQGEMKVESVELPHSEVTTLGTDGGENSSSLAVRSVRCARTLWPRWRIILNHWIVVTLMGGIGA